MVGSSRATCASVFFSVASLFAAVEANRGWAGEDVVGEWPTPLSCAVVAGGTGKKKGHDGIEGGVPDEEKEDATLAACRPGFPSSRCGRATRGEENVGKRGAHSPHRISPTHASLGGNADIFSCSPAATRTLATTNACRTSEIHRVSTIRNVFTSTSASKTTAPCFGSAWAAEGPPITTITASPIVEGETQRNTPGCEMESGANPHSSDASAKRFPASVCRVTFFSLPTFPACSSFIFIIFVCVPMVEDRTGGPSVVFFLRIRFEVVSRGVGAAMGVA